MLCLICGRNDLKFTEYPPDPYKPGERPEVQKIECINRGSGEPSKCRYHPGTPQFNLVAKWYSVDVEATKSVMALLKGQRENLQQVISQVDMESTRIVIELLKQQRDFLQLIVFQAYDEVASVEAARVARTQTGKLPTLPGELHPYEPPTNENPP